MRGGCRQHRSPSHYPGRGSPSVPVTQTRGDFTCARSFWLPPWSWSLHLPRQATAACRCPRRQPLRKPPRTTRADANQRSRAQPSKRRNMSIARRRSRPPRPPRRRLPPRPRQRRPQRRRRRASPPRRHGKGGQAEAQARLDRRPHHQRAAPPRHLLVSAATRLQKQMAGHEPGHARIDWKRGGAYCDTVCTTLDRPRARPSAASGP